MQSPSECELANDLDGDVANWWRQVRDNTDELVWKTSCTPASRTLFDESLALLEGGGGSALDRAVAFQCVVTQSVTNSRHGVAWAPKYGNRKYRDSWAVLGPLAARIWNLQLECRPAEEILDRAKDVERAVVYCDPPYAGAVTTPYVNKGAYDQKLIAKLLLAQRGFAAVSGYEADGWDELLPGWERFDKAVPFRGICDASILRGEQKRRVESLWVNKPLTGTQELAF